jgi:hypothetical protein
MRIGDSLGKAQGVLKTLWEGHSLQSSGEKLTIKVETRLHETHFPPCLQTFSLGCVKRKIQEENLPACREEGELLGLLPI